MKVTEEILSTARIPGTSTALRTTRAAELTATQERTGTSEKADIRRTSYGSGSSRQKVTVPTVPVPQHW
jgi:hypothetical protein